MCTHILEALLLIASSHVEPRTFSPSRNSETCSCHCRWWLFSSGWRREMDASSPMDSSECRREGIKVLSQRLSKWPRWPALLFGSESTGIEHAWIAITSYHAWPINDGTGMESRIPADVRSSLSSDPWLHTGEHCFACDGMGKIEWRLVGSGTLENRRKIILFSFSSLINYGAIIIGK